MVCKTYIYIPRQLKRKTSRKECHEISGKNSRHIKIRYFFITNRVKDNELKIVYCPTKEMVADFFAKSYARNII